MILEWMKSILTLMKLTMTMLRLRVSPLLAVLTIGKVHPKRGSLARIVSPSSSLSSASALALASALASSSLLFLHLMHSLNFKATIRVMFIGQTTIGLIIINDERMEKTKAMLRMTMMMASSENWRGP